MHAPLCIRDDAEKRQHPPQASKVVDLINVLSQRYFVSMTVSLKMVCLNDNTPNSIMSQLTNMLALSSHKDWNV